jgi:hypothetical protein
MRSGIFSRFVIFQALAPGKISSRSSRLKPFLAHVRGHHECRYARTARTASSLAAASESRDGLRSATPWERASTMSGTTNEFEPRGNRKPEHKPRWVGKSK